MVWGTFLEKIKWAFAWFWGGLNPCQDGLGHLCSENWSSIRYFLLLTRDLRLARILCGTYIPSKRWFDKVAQIGPEKSAPECPFECGWGGAKAKRAMPQCPQHEFEGCFPKVRGPMGQGLITLESTHTRPLYYYIRVYACLNVFKWYLRLGKNIDCIATSFLPISPWPDKLSVHLDAGHTITSTFHWHLLCTIPIFPF